MKILYALSVMHRGILQVWAENETNVVSSHTSTFSTLTGLLAGMKMTYSDPDQVSRFVLFTIISSMPKSYQPS